MSVTRKVHVVRCTDAPQDDPTNYSRFVDVLVLDAIALLGPNGEEFVFDCAAKHAVPTIIDDTGDGESRTPGNPTRLSHMERLRNADDDTLFLDMEILDAFALCGPNGAETLFDMRNPGATNIVDNTDLNLGQIVAAASRRAHVLKIEPSDKPTTQEIMQGATPANPTPGTSGDYLAVLVLDAIAFGGPIGASEGGDPTAELRANGEMLLLAGNSDLSDSQLWNDTTQYDADGNPPVNDDPHIYVRFPVVDGVASGSPWLGSNPTSDQNPDRSGPLCQGLLWQVINASGTPLVVISVVSVPPGGPPVSWGHGAGTLVLLNDPITLPPGLPFNYGSPPFGPTVADLKFDTSGGNTVTITPKFIQQTGVSGEQAIKWEDQSAVGEQFGGSAGANAGDYQIINLSGLVRAVKALEPDAVKGSVQFKFQVDLGPADANKFPFTIQIQTFGSATKFQQSPDSAFLKAAGGIKAADTYNSSFGKSGLGYNFIVTIDMSTLKISVNAFANSGSGF
jgi:hypothetical protein